MVSNLAGIDANVFGLIPIDAGPPALGEKARTFWSNKGREEKNKKKRRKKAREEEKMKNEKGYHNTSPKYPPLVRFAGLAIIYLLVLSHVANPTGLWVPSRCSPSPFLYYCGRPQKYFNFCSDMLTSTKKKYSFHKNPSMLGPLRKPWARNFASHFHGFKHC
jgi:hypothetical protein